MFQKTNKKRKTVQQGNRGLKADGNTQHEQRLFCFCPTAFYFMRTLTVLGNFWHKKSPFRSKQTNKSTVNTRKD